MSISKSIFIMIMGIALIVFANLAWAQTETTEETPSTKDTPTLAVETTQIRVQPILVTDIPLNDAVAIDLGALAVPGVSPTLTRGVTVKAYTRYVEYEGQRIGQLVLTGVEKNGVKEPLPANLFNAQFNLDQPRLEPGEDVLVEGDAASMIAALEKLNETNDEEVAEDETVEPETVVSQNDPGSQQSNSGSGNSNDLAGAYQAPESVYVAPEGEEVINVTTQGCTVRIDIPQMQAYQQSKTETVKDGAVIDQSSCSDDISNTFSLQKSYSVCSENIDLAVSTATAQYVLFYTDAGGARQEVTACANDVEKIFPIVEKPESCTIYLDYASFEAVPQAALVYQDDSNVEIQVRGCEASTANPAVPLTQTNDGCTIRHDFTGSISHQQGAYIYELDGVQYQAGGCADTGVTYAQLTLYDGNAGGFLCSPVVDLSSGNATLQSRVQITVDGLGQFITDCTPDASSLNLTATTDGCDNPFGWQHDLSAGQSYGQERFYFTYNGVPDYVTECQASTAVYPHQIETTGWQDHDDQLYAYELSTIYIMPPTGRYDVAVSQVLSGATQMPYELTGSETKENGALYYEGCDRFTETSNYELWKRPDESTYEKDIGTGDPLGPLSACTISNDLSWPQISLTYMVKIRKAGSGTGHSNCGIYKQGLYEGTHSITREDGVVISSDTATRTINGSTSWNGMIIMNYEGNTVSKCKGWFVNGINWNAGSVPPDPATGVTVLGWLDELAWR